MKGARPCCGRSPGHMWEDRQDQTGVSMSSGMRPKSTRVLYFSREKQGVSGLWCVYLVARSCLTLVTP